VTQVKKKNEKENMKKDEKTMPNGFKKKTKDSCAMPRDPATTGELAS
jgi:hypothetical protein